MRFLGISLSDKVLDENPIWDFENTLAQAGIMEELFCMFDTMLEKEGLITHTGTIIDATFVDAPKQRNHHDENKTINEGKVLEEGEKPENAHKLAQKDTDARWTKKNKEAHFGYKDHVKCDADSKLITNYGVTDAALHDSQRCTELLENSDKSMYADSAYSSAEITEKLPENCEDHICEKATEIIL